MKTPLSLIKVCATSGCIAMLALSGATQAKTVIIDLGTINSAETFSGYFRFQKKEKVIFKFTVEQPYDFKFTGIIDGKKFIAPLTWDKTGEDGNFTEVIGSFSHKGKLDYAMTTSVAEPAAWALMILGMGAVGGVARRRSWHMQLA